MDLFAPGQSQRISLGNFEDYNNTNQIIITIILTLLYYLHYLEYLYQLYAEVIITQQYCYNIYMMQYEEQYY